MIDIEPWRALCDADGLCHCAECGGTLFFRDPDPTAPPQSHPTHAHPERRGKGYVDFPRCIHIACFIANLPPVGEPAP